MGEEQMKEIADILNLILSQTKPETIASGANAGQQSKAKYIIEAKAKDQAQIRIQEILKDFQVYPELDEDLLASIIE